MMVLDFTYTSARFHPAHELAFARVGYVSDSSAKILFREPRPDQLPVSLSYRLADDFESLTREPWSTAGSIDHLTDETDFTAVIEIQNLLPDSRYEYTLSNQYNGFFITAPAPGKISTRVDARRTFTFLHSSCFIPRFPYVPGAHPLHIPGLKHLSKWLPILRPAFFLFLGDFIYIDVPHRHGSDIDTYRREYRQVYASPDWPSITSTRTSSVSPYSHDDFDIPWLHVYDDHEIANDWDANTTGIFPAAFDSYTHYHVAGNPPTYRAPASTDLLEANNTYFTFVHGPASFFLADTRRFRTSSGAFPPNHPAKSILGKQQLADLLAWLSAPEPSGVRWKVFVSSVPFTKNWRVNAVDTWTGYLFERRIILEAMWDVAAAGIGVVVLSGDRHEFAATAFPPPSDGRWGKEATVHEFSTSPLNMFYLPIKTYWQTDDQDVCLEYLPGGNSKFGAVEISDETEEGRSALTYRVFVDGVERWSHELQAPSL